MTYAYVMKDHENPEVGVVKSRHATPEEAEAAAEPSLGSEFLFLSSKLYEPGDVVHIFRDRKV